MSEKRIYIKYSQLYKYMILAFNLGKNDGTEQDLEELMLKEDIIRIEEDIK